MVEKTGGGQKARPDPEQVRANLSARILGFLISWGAYFLAIAAMAVVGLFVVGPILNYVKSGFFQIVPSVEILVKVSKAVLSSSLFLTVVMSLWAAMTKKNSEG